MRIAFAVLIGLHGLLHLLGATKGFGWADVPQLRTPITPLSAALWLGAIAMARRALVSGVFIGLAILVRPNLAPLAIVLAAIPFIQFGMSTAKDFPGFLAGAGFRFTSPVAFSISAGGMITRYKDLDDPSRLNKPISGTAEIKDHLIDKTSPVALYGAIQLKF